MMIDCICRSEGEGVLNIMVCTEPKEVPIHRVGRALESENKDRKSYKTVIVVLTKLKFFKG